MLSGVLRGADSYSGERRFCRVLRQVDRYDRSVEF